MVHRPAYDDWTFPKGKADGDELDEDTALREVEEETGLRVHARPRAHHDALRRPPRPPEAGPLVLA